MWESAGCAGSGWVNLRCGCATRQEGEHVVHVGLIETPLQLGGSAQGFDFTIHHDRNAVAIFGLVHVVGGETKRDCRASGVVDQFPKLAARLGIYPAGRFVEEHNARIVEDAHRKGQFLFPSLRQTRH